MNVLRSTHLKMAAGLWGLVGLCLLMAGLMFLFRGTDIAMNAWIAFVIALVIGFVKGKIVLPKVAKKNIARIQGLPEQSPVYMTFNAKSWMLVLGMILLGKIIRLLGAPDFVRGAIYVAVGIALLLGSRTYLEERA